VLEAARLTLKDLGKVPATDVTSLPLVLRFYFHVPGRLLASQKSFQNKSALFPGKLNAKLIVEFWFEFQTNSRVLATKYTYALDLSKI